MKKPDFIGRFFPIPVFLLAVSGCAIIEPYTDLTVIESELNDYYPGNHLLENIPVLTQPNDSTCGITAVAVECNYINSRNDTVGDYVSRQSVDIYSGADAADIQRWLKNELPGRDVQYRSEEDTGVMIETIFDSLVRNIPVIVFFGAPNPYNMPLYDFHASVVYGYDISGNEIHISNSYGYLETITIVDFLNRMNFSEIDRYPDSQQFLLRCGLISRNMYFLVK